MHYKIHLTTYNFTRDYSDVLRFGTREEQLMYFGITPLESGVFSNAPVINISFGDFLHPVQVGIPAPTDTSTHAIASKNYCIVQELDDSGAVTGNYYYFFVTSVDFLSGAYVNMTLELDIFQTYYIDAQFNDTLIRRAHLDRFYKNGNTILFDFRPQSLLHNAENLPVGEKYITARNVSGITGYNRTTNNAQLLDWVRDNVAFWVYGYMSKGQYEVFKDGTYNHIQDFETGMYVTGRSVDTSLIGSSTLNTEIFTVCYPIYKNANLSLNNVMKYRYTEAGGSRDITIRSDAFDTFLSQNNDYSRVYAIVVSMAPPMIFGNYASYIIDDNNNLILINNDETIGDYSTPYGRIILTGTQGSSIPSSAMFYVYNYTNKLFDAGSITKSFAQNLNITNLQNGELMDFEPKLYTQSYLNAVARLPDNNEAPADFTLCSTPALDNSTQECNGLEIGYIYKETPTPDVTRYNLTVRGSGEVGDSVYPDVQSRNPDGLFGAVDNSLPVTNDQLQQMLANNKNFALQRTIDIGASLLGLGVGLANKSTFGGVLGGISGSGLGNNLSDIIFTTSNLRNAPDTLKNANGNALFNIVANDTPIVLELHEALPAVKQSAWAYFLQYGYSVNLIGNVKNYDNSRVRYNYVQADNVLLLGTYNRGIKQEFAEAFRRGVRFWNYDENNNYFDYTIKGNIERGLLNANDSE